MNKIDFKEAYYIQLGEKGVWRGPSIYEGKIKIGWPEQSLEDINRGRWSIIEERLRTEINNKGAATRDFNALKNICESADTDIWITYFDSKFWWCRVGVNTIYEDATSKYRNVKDRWYDKNIYGQSISSDVAPESLLQIYQHFHGTACRIKAKDELWSLINCRRASTPT